MHSLVKSLCLFQKHHLKVSIRSGQESSASMAVLVVRPISGQAMIERVWANQSAIASPYLHFLPLLLSLRLALCHLVAIFCLAVKLTELLFSAAAIGLTLLAYLALRDKQQHVVLTPTTV